MMKRRAASMWRLLPGFTLIEILVALVVFSFLSVMVVQGYSSMAEYGLRKRIESDQGKELQQAWGIILQDMLHLRARPVRDRLGGLSRAYEVSSDGEYAVLFTRGGLPLVPGVPGGLQRVAYSVSSDNELLRWTWPTLESFVAQDPKSQVLMKDIQAIEFQQLNNRNEFEPNWPPLNQQVAPEVLPRMIQVVFEFEGYRVERLVPGTEAALLSIVTGNGNNQRRIEDADDPDAVAIENP